MERLLAIGDIHGCSRTFKSLLIDKFNLLKSDRIICVGDYIDRGPDSKGVIDFILELRSAGYNVLTLRGNHEQIMMDSPYSLDTSRQWMLNGGDKTLDSFGTDSYQDFKQEYKTFFEDTKYYLTHEKFIFVHAGLNLKIENPFEDQHAMLWLRDFKATSFLDDRIVIHGHTPITIDKLMSQSSSQIINIDGGCVYNQKEGLGNLIGYDISANKFISVKNIDF